MGAVVITDHVARWSWNCWYQSSSNSLNNWTRFSWHGVQLVLAEIHDKLYRQIIFNSLKKIPWYQGVIHQRFFYLNENTFQLVCLRAVTFNTRNYLESKLTAGSSRFLFLSNLRSIILNLIYILIFKWIISQHTVYPYGHGVPSTERYCFIW